MKKVLTFLFIIFIYFFTFAQKVTEKAVEINVINDYFLLKKATSVLSNKNRISIPFEIPKNTVRWFYTITAYRKKEDIENAKQNIKLFAQLSRLIDETGTTEKAINLLVKPPGGDYCNLFLMYNFNDNEAFKNGSPNFEYSELYSVKNAVSGMKQVDEGGREKMYFIGVENPTLSADLHINIQITAIIRVEPEINGWTRQAKDEIFKGLMYFNKEKHNHHLSENLIYELSTCMIKKMTSKYSNDDLINQATYEQKEIYTNLHVECEEELGLKSKYKINENVASEETLIGFWSDENSMFEFRKGGFFRLKFDNNNEIREGKWEIYGNFLAIKIKLNKDTDQYAIEKFDNSNMTYRYIKNGQKYNAKRISEDKFNKNISYGFTNNNVEPNFYDLIGKWKADNCTYTLNSDGTIYINWFTGGITKGIWQFANSQLKVKYENSKTWSYYNFINFSKSNMKYQLISTNQIFTANKIN